MSGKDLAERAAKFRDMVARRDEGFSQGGRELFDLLLKPAIRQLDNKSSWTIVPDSFLWLVPFQALQPDGRPRVVERHAISYAPSLTALHELRKPRVMRMGPSKLLAFANPAISRQRKERIKLGQPEVNLDPSPEGENEVRALRQLYSAAGSEIYLGAQAREATAKRRAGDFNALHFATPATLNDLSPMYSHVALADSDAGGLEDGLLEAWEIMRLGLRAELAVLSASQASDWRDEFGSGLIGLTWALFVAGCPTTVVGEWKVDSPSNTELMLEFHRLLQPTSRAQNGFGARRGRGPAPSGLRPRISKAEALRRASLKLMQNSHYSHPFFWAGYAVVGDGR
ncbi:MAG: CHAT domain-containing protein [Blastocatellia bacterium]